MIREAAWTLDCPSKQCRRGGILLTTFCAGALLFIGCGEPTSAPGTDHNASGDNSDGATNAEGEPGKDSTGDSSDGLIDVEGGFTQDEQMAELETVVGVMREHFGDDVATVEGEPWTVELHEEEVSPRSREGDLYNHVINFDVSPGELEEMYATADEIASELGLTENENNSHGITEYGRIFYGAGREDDRTFVMAGESADSFRATYKTRHTDHESVVEARDRVLEKREQERQDEFGPDNPRQLEDIEGYVEGDEESSD